MSTKMINQLFSDLAQYNRLADETAAIIDGIKDQIKEYMTANGLETLSGDEHKAIYKNIESSRLDSKALKNELPEVAARYTVTNSVMRFTFS